MITPSFKLGEKQKLFGLVENFPKLLINTYFTNKFRFNSFFFTTKERVHTSEKNIRENSGRVKARPQEHNFRVYGFSNAP